MRKLQAVSLMIVALLAIGGCNGSAKKADAPADGRPALVVPASFSSDAEKLVFSADAVTKGYYAEARPLLEAMVKDHPNAIASNYLGTACYNLGDYTGAISAWSTAAELDERLAPAMETYIGNAYRDSNKPQEAGQAYRKALEMDPQQWQAAVNLATMLRLDGKISDAVAVLEKTIPDNPRVTQLAALRDDLRVELKAKPQT